MLGIRNFVIGFCLSMFSVMLCGRLSSSTPIYSNHIITQPIKISLFRPHSDKLVNSSHFLFAEVKKQTLAIADNSSDNLQKSYSPDGIEDEEIISINFDDQIPIEFNVSSNNVEPATLAEELNKEQKVALLPDNDIEKDTPSSIDTPWVTAKTKKASKNKNLEALLSNHNENLFTENIQQLAKNDDAVSYKVAERIKQSIIFPIPDEILNDENLTPTFVDNPKKNSPKKEVATKDKKAEEAPSPQFKKPQNTAFKKPTKTASNSNTAQDTENSGILDSISSWFNTSKQSSSPSASTPTNNVKRKKTAPTYGSSGATKANNARSNNNELADIYSSLQETRQEYAHRKIVPSELKLSFQPGRAEISGSTLTWLKAFSEAAINDDIRLQIRLDASASTELQKKRLNLLYTIFMNNGVNFKKVDTVFSNTEPNAFIIRTIRNK